MASLVYDGITIDTRVYTDAARMTSSSYHNGVSESRIYNDDNTPAGISFTGASIGNLTYGWDANKNKTSESISGYGFGVGTSGYDNKDRLVNWQRADSALDQSWDLSLLGDRTSITENSSPQNRTHGPTHELVSVASQSVTHDAKGNLTLIPAVLRPSPSGLPSPASRLTWDFENKLLAADIDNDRGTPDQAIHFLVFERNQARDWKMVHTSQTPLPHCISHLEQSVPGSLQSLRWQSVFLISSLAERTNDWHLSDR